MRVSLLGGGGFRAPFVWDSLRGQPVDELVLYDTNRRHLDRIEGVISELEGESPGGPSVVTTQGIEEALEGVDYVFCALRVGGLDGRVWDETIPLRHGVLGQETVGPGGICFALRTVPVMLELAREVERRNPGAWFLNFTNPAGLVTEALREVLGDRVVGICDAPAALCARVAAALGRSADELDFDYAGLNHLGWVTAARAGETDLLPGLLSDREALDSILEVQLMGADRVVKLGMVPNEYLVYYERTHEIVASFERAGVTRAQVLLEAVEGFYRSDDDPLEAWRRARDARFGSYMAEAPQEAPVPSSDGDEDAVVDEGPGESGYAAIAAAFLGGTAPGGPARDIVLNVANRGRLPHLDDRAVVETTCRVTDEGVLPRSGLPLPPAAADLVARVKAVERLTIRAATSGSRELALEAIAAHPVTPSRDVAGRILDGYLAAFPDLARDIH